MPKKEKGADYLLKQMKRVLAEVERKLQKARFHHTKLALALDAKDPTDRFQADDISELKLRKCRAKTRIQTCEGVVVRLRVKIDAAEAELSAETAKPDEAEHLDDEDRAIIDQCTGAEAPNLRQQEGPCDTDLSDGAGGHLRVTPKQHSATDPSTEDVWQGGWENHRPREVSRQMAAAIPD